LNFAKQQALFAVFDGHGGREVAKYSEKHFPHILTNEDLYKNQSYKEALRRSFMKVDESLNAGGLKEVAEMKK
jgi:serine/threonine protein phosphatase PrpC